ncbi:hypothetical protein D3C78_1406440 [compost metagenome]
MEKNAQFYKNLLSIKAVPSFRNHLQARLNKQIMEHIDENNLNLDVRNKEICMQFLSSAVVGVVEWWFNQTPRCPAEEMTEQLSTLLEHNQMLLRND